MRLKFGRGFGTEAVRRVTERALSVAQACRDLDVAGSVPRRRMRDLAEALPSAFPGHGPLSRMPSPPTSA